MMGVHSGKFAAVNGKSTVRNWSINDTNATKAFIASNTGGGTGRLKGNHDWSGSYSQYSGIPAVMPGSALSFTGYSAPDSDVNNTTGKTKSGTAIVDSIAC